MMQVILSQNSTAGAENACREQCTDKLRGLVGITVPLVSLRASDLFIYLFVLCVNSVFVKDKSCLYHQKKEDEENEKCVFLVTEMVLSRELSHHYHIHPPPGIDVTSHPGG